MTVAIGVDVGSTTTKAVLVDVDDIAGATVLHVATAATPGTADGVVSAAARVVRACMAATTEGVAAVGIASMAESGAALDADGLALTPFLRWDRRVDRRHLESLLETHPALPATTGVPATTKPAAVALLALRVEQPEVHARMRHWAGAADLVAHAMTGIRAIDRTLAARTMLAGRGEEWDAEVAARIGIPLDALPALRAPGEKVAVTTSDAGRFGLPPGVAVHIAGHDHAVAAWAVGCRVPGATADSLGTSEAIVRITDTVDAARALAEGFAVGTTIDGAATTVLAGSPTCGALLALWDERRPQDGIPARLRALDPVDWSASPVTVLPFPLGRQCPSPDPAATMRVLGDGTRSTGQDADGLARGILQSLVAHARWMRETADHVVGSPTSGVTAVGSLLRRIPAWAPMIAAAGPPTRVALADEPVAAGAALHAAVAVGLADPRLSVLPSTPVVPMRNAEAAAVYERFRAGVGHPIVDHPASSRTPSRNPSEGES